MRKVFSEDKSVELSATIVSSPEPGRLVNDSAAINCAVVIVIPEAVIISKPFGKLACVASKWPLTTSKVPIELDITLEDDKTTVSSCPVFFADVSNSNLSAPVPDNPAVLTVNILELRALVSASLIRTVTSSSPTTLPERFKTVAFCAFTSNKFCEELPSNEISNSAKAGTSKSTALKFDTVV